MTTALHEPEPWIIRAPDWSAPTLVIPAIVVLGLAGALGLGLLLLMSPVILAAGAVELMRHRSKRGADRATWPPRPRDTHAVPPVSEGEYEVVDESAPRKPEGPKPGTSPGGPRDAS